MIITATPLFFTAVNTNGGLMASTANLFKNIDIPEIAAAIMANLTPLLISIA
jgi:hypothetical protein